MTYRILGFCFRVQSSKYDPLYLHGRIDHFIKGLQELLVRSSLQGSLISDIILDFLLKITLLSFNSVSHVHLFIWWAVSLLNCILKANGKEIQAFFGHFKTLRKMSGWHWLLIGEGTFVGCWIINNVIFRSQSRYGKCQACEKFWCHASLPHFWI